MEPLSDQRPSARGAKTAEILVAEQRGSMEIAQLRNTERAAYLRCRWRWDKAFNDNLQPKRTALPLRFGDLIHRALAEHYIPGKSRNTKTSPIAVFGKLYDEVNRRGLSLLDAVDQDWIDAEQLGISMLSNYLIHYAGDPQIEIIAPEQPFQVKLYNPKSGKHVVTAVGTIDAVYRNRNNGQIGLLEHKTAASIQTNHLQLDEQVAMYHAAGGQFLREQGILGPKQEISHVLYNFLRKSLQDGRPRDDEGRSLNKDGTVSARQPAPYFKRLPVYRDAPNHRRMLRRLRQIAWEMKQVRAGRLPIYKNPTRDCSWDCAFVDICELDEAGADWPSLVPLEFDTWEPYEQHAEPAQIALKEMLNA